MVKEGDPVPDVRMEGAEGKPVSPADFKGQKLVVYFYPKDDTSGCTSEAQAFTALADEFRKAGTWILGVSKDDAKSHAKFTAKYGLEVTIRTGGPQVNGLPLLAAGQLDVVMADALQALAAVEQQVPITAIAASRTPIECATVRSSVAMCLNIARSRSCSGARTASPRGNIDTTRAE